MPSSPSIAACLVLHDGATPPALEADVRRLVQVADEVVVYDTGDHLAPGTPAFEATLHPAVTVVSGFWAEDRDRAHQAALAHVASDWTLCLLAGERVEIERTRLRQVLAEACDLPALSVRVDDVVRGSHRSPRLLHTSRTPLPPSLQGADVAEVPSEVLRVSQPVDITAGIPRQRGVFDRV
ncbi:hypothetical protein ACFFKU_11645 [Kineococcus gynurae]|uniref:Glycosyl transferase family 2 n=1 Tax=Kineococcus gynurae TaxID=452979 RepID=A0ABV5LR90_9ACTN